MQHSTEMCLVCYKGKNIWKNKGLNAHILWASRLTQSQKPNILYHLIENKFPQGNYLELFGRSLNLRQK